MSVSQKNEDLKNDSTYHQILKTIIGEDGALHTINKLREDESKKNISETEFSTTAQKIIIPHSMNKKQASEELQRQWQDEETLINVDYTYDGYNWRDVLVAVKKVTEEHFGWISGVTINSFFGSQLPTELEVVTDVVDGKNITETCFYGRVKIATWENAELTVDGNYLSATVKKRYSTNAKEYYAKIGEYLKTKSIYRGKSITVTRQNDPWGNPTLNFDIFELKSSNNIVLNDDIKRLIDNFIIDDIGEQGKRCYLFSGGYGNAKTETAMQIGQIGKERGLAFFYCKDAEMFHTLLNVAKNYQPCIIFMEDIDEIGSGEERDSRMNKILNTLDGVQTKNNNLTVIFTTNHENRINPALRRPGRIDLVINFQNPNAKSIYRIYNIYLKDLINKYGNTDINFEELAIYTGDVPGAVVAEIAKRAVKLCEKKRACTMELCQSAVDSMKHHLELMAEPIESKGKQNITITVENANLPK